MQPFTELELLGLYYEFLPMVGSKHCPLVVAIQGVFCGSVLLFCGDPVWEMYLFIFLSWHAFWFQH